MPWIPMYLLPPDIELLNGWLNEESEIAFLVSQGRGQWIAQEKRSILKDLGTQTAAREYPDFLLLDFAEYNLWHVPSEPLPSLAGEGTIANPWDGWTEVRGGQNHRVPYFGAGHPGIIGLKLKMYPIEEISMSNFGWIGNHYKIMGKGAEKSTEQFWKRLRSVIRKMAVQVSRGNNLAWKKEVFAFPAAFQAIQEGQPCALNP